MTVATTTRKMTPQAMDGVTLDFNFSFRALTTDVETIKAFITDGSGVNTDLVYGDSGINGYTVSVNSNGIGGAITVINARTSDYTITIYREVGITQGSDYNDRNSFPAETLESNLDKLTMIAQEIDEEISRSIKVDINSSIDATLPTASAGKALLWNATADAIENSTDDFNDIVTDAVAAKTAAETAQGLAEAAKVGAEAAQGLSEAARDASVIAQGLSESARDDALIAQGDAEAARDLAEDWASKTDGQVDATDYSSKAYAIGGTGVTGVDGAAKEWAIETSSTVDGSNYSSKEWATGTQIRGDASGGSAKDWATYTGGTVDDTEYSAKYYANLANVSKIEWQGSWSAGSYDANDAVEHNGSSWIATTTTIEEPSITATDWDLLALRGTDGTGSGDVSSSISSSTDNAVAVFDGVGGKTIKQGTSGTDYSAGTASLDTGILKSTTSTGALTIATASDIPTPMTTRGDILYHDGSSWARLAKGTSGQVLTQGANDPAWATPSAGGTIYGTCSTSGSTAAKTVSYSGFTLETGATINVLFSNANTATSPTLNVNSTGAKSIATETGTVTSSTYPAYFPASSIITFVYDGAYWRFKNNIVKAYVSGTSWYNIWANGFKQQGSYHSGSGGVETTTTLPIAFRDTNYEVVGISVVGICSIVSLATTTFKWKDTNNFGTGFHWIASGY